VVSEFRTEIERIRGPFNVGLQTRVSERISHGLDERAMLSVVVLDPQPIPAETRDEFPLGLNFAVTIYPDPEERGSMRIAATVLAPPNQLRVSFDSVTVRWFALLPS
jgi:hypothetical protein